MVARHAGRVRAGGRGRRPGRPLGRYLRHRRRSQRHDQRVDHRRPGRGRGGRAGVQARGRAASSKAGSADVLEALGVVIDLGPPGWPAASRRRGSGSASRPATTRRCDTPSRCGASWACRPRSTSSARWPTRPGSAARSSGSAIRPWPPRWLGCWPPAGPFTPWSCTAPTGSTSCRPPARRPCTSGGRRRAGARRRRLGRSSRSTDRRPGRPRSGAGPAGGSAGRRCRHQRRPGPAGARRRGRTASGHRAPQRRRRSGGGRGQRRPGRRPGAGGRIDR